MGLLELASRIEAYDPRLSPDNHADELDLHRDIVLATGNGSMNPVFEATFLRSLDAAMTLVPEGCATMQDWSRYADSGSVAYDCAVQVIVSGKTLGSGLNAVSPALALCAAALRARRHQTKDPHHEG